ncbi:MAG: PcfJ domain-containing protein [Victivallales bacterium]|nr:PcfJ domain-containing protein [Victivallales bacterium]
MNNKNHMTEGYVKRGKTGQVFKPETGKLYIFDKYSVRVLQGWPVVHAWKKTTVKQPRWVSFRPNLNWLERELREDGKRQEECRRAIENGLLEPPKPIRYGKEDGLYCSPGSRWYFETTPRAIRELLSPFWNSRWALMGYLAAGGQPAADLLKSCPALAFMLAHNRIFHTPAVEKPRRAIRTWLGPGKTRKMLSSWLGFPLETNCARILAKVHPKDISIGFLLKLRTLIKDARVLKFLRHQPVIDRALLAFFEPDMLEMLTMKLLTELRRYLLDHLAYESFFHHDEPVRESQEALVFWNKDSQAVWQQFRDTARMFRFLYPERPMPLLRDLGAMSRLHDKLAEAYQKHRFDNIVFTPPVLGNANIIPLTTYAMLCDEGQQQHNCVASYVEEVLEGRSFIYRVLQPERCTLELALRGGRWVVVQLRTACNGAPSKETIDSVNRWLAEASGKS